MKKRVLTVCLSLILLSCGTSKENIIRIDNEPSDAAYDSLIQDRPTVRLLPEATLNLIDGKYVFVETNDRGTLKMELSTISTYSVISQYRSFPFVFFGSHDEFKTALQKTYGGYKLVTSKYFDSDLSKTSGQIYLIRYTSYKGFQGLYGMDAFFEAEKQHPILLDYKNNKIKLLPSVSTIPEEYQKVDASLFNNRFYLKATIKEKVYWLGFSSSLEAFVNLSNLYIDKKPNEFKKENEETVIFYKNVPINIEGLLIDETVIEEYGPHTGTLLKNTYSGDYLGWYFIRNYNWILDYAHGRLYAKKIKDFNANDYISVLRKE